MDVYFSYRVIYVQGYTHLNNITYKYINIMCI